MTSHISLVDLLVNLSGQRAYAATTVTTVRYGPSTSIHHLPYGRVVFA